MTLTRRAIITSASGLGVLAASTAVVAHLRQAEKAPELDVSKLRTVFRDDFKAFALYDPERNPTGRWATAGVKAFDGSIKGRSGSRPPSLAEVDSDPQKCLAHRAPKNAGDMALFADETLGPELRTAFVAEDGLRMIAKPIPTSLQRQACGKTYITPRIWLTDRGKPKGFRYGYFEARIRFDVELGAHGAFWLMPTGGGWGSEIDIVEYLGVWSKTGGQGDQYHTAVHLNEGATDLPKRITGNQINHAWRRFGVLWTAKSLTFYLDRRPVREIPNPGIHDAMYPILNLAVGSPWAVNTARGQQLSKSSHQMTVSEFLVAEPPA